MTVIQGLIEVARQLEGQQAPVLLGQPSSLMPLEQLTALYDVVQTPENMLILQGQPFITRCALVSYLGFLCFQNFERDCKDARFVEIFMAVNELLKALITEAAQIDTLQAHLNVALLLSNRAMLVGKSLGLPHKKQLLARALGKFESIERREGRLSLKQSFHKALILLNLTKTHVDLRNYLLAKCYLDRALTILPRLDGYYSPEIQTTVAELSQTIESGLSQESAVISLPGFRRSPSFRGRLRFLDEKRRRLANVVAGEDKEDDDAAAGFSNGGPAGAGGPP